METYVLADKVITQQHMTSSQDKPKYLKKYDLPPNSLKSRTRTTPHKKPFLPITVINAPRTKDLLSQLSNYQKIPNYSQPSMKIEKYFTLSSQPYREICKRNKNGLLVRRLQPKSQQYDANFIPISRRAPCWGFSPKRTEKQIMISSQQLPFSAPQTQQKKRQPRAKVLELCQFVDRQDKIKGEAIEADSRLQYCSDELGKSTVQIFKKYSLDNDPYFKKFLASLPQ